MALLFPWLKPGILRAGLIKGYADASAVLTAVEQLASLDISNRVYTIDPTGVHEKL